jgi:hypothetical protein
MNFYAPDLISFVFEQCLSHIIFTGDFGLAKLLNKDDLASSVMVEFPLCPNGISELAAMLGIKVALTMIIAASQEETCFKK